MTNDKLEEGIKNIKTCIQETATSNSAFTKLKELRAKLSNQMNDCKSNIKVRADTVGKRNF